MAGLIQAQHQVDQGGLAAAGFADEGDLFAAMCCKAHALDDRLVFFVREGHIVEFEDGLGNVIGKR